MEVINNPAHQNFKVLTKKWLDGEPFLTFPLDHYLGLVELNMNRPSANHNDVTRSALLTILNLAAPKIELPSILRRKSKYNIYGEVAKDRSQREVSPSKLSASSFIRNFTYFAEQAKYIGIDREAVVRRSGISDEDYYGFEEYLIKNRLAYQAKRHGFSRLSPGANYLNQLTKFLGGVEVVDNRMLQSGAALILTHRRPNKSESDVANYYNKYSIDLLGNQNFQNEIGVRKYKGYQPLTFTPLQYQQVTYTRAKAKCLDNQGKPVPDFEYSQAGLNNQLANRTCYECELVKYCGLRIGNVLLEQQNSHNQVYREQLVQTKLDSLLTIANRET